MSKSLKKCPDCGQQLRFPQNIGGMLMACPTCGKTFASDFKIGPCKDQDSGGVRKEGGSEELPARTGGTFRVVV